MYRSLLHNPVTSIRGLATTPTSLQSTVLIAANLTARNNYATHSGLGGNSSGPTRKQVSVMTDDGRYAWSELSGREKVARATQQSFNFVIVVVGVVMTVHSPFLFFSAYISISILMAYLINRAAFWPSSIPMYSHQIAKLGSLKRQSIASRKTHDVHLCSEIAKRSKHMEKQRGTNGLETGQLRMHFSPIYPSDDVHANSRIRTTVQKDSLGREHMRMNFHVSLSPSSFLYYLNLI